MVEGFKHTDIVDYLRFPWCVCVHQTAHTEAHCETRTDMDLLVGGPLWKASGFLRGFVYCTY